MNKTKSKVMTMANTLVKQDMNRRAATVKACVIAKASALRTKIKGTSRRQSELEKLSALSAEEITVQLKREPHNAHDSNAIAVYAVTAERVAFFIGYISKAVSSVLAPLFDKGNTPEPTAFSITGGYNPYVNYGATLAIRV